MYNNYLKKLILKINLIFLIGIFFCSCSVSKLIPEKQFLFTGASVDLNSTGKGGIPRKKQLKSTLDDALRPKPNKKIFGIRYGVYFYYKSGGSEQKKGIFNKLKRKLSEKPVLLQDIVPERVSQNLRALLINNGYFEAKVEPTIKKKNKFASILYTATIYTPPYRYRNISFSGVEKVYSKLSNRLVKETLIKKGRPYKLDRLENELKRIEGVVRDSGFYFFNSKYLIWNADTSVGDRKIDIKLGFEGEVPAQAKKAYRLSTVDVINDYTISKDSLNIKYDTTHITGFNYINRRNNFRKEIILRAINLHKDSLYSRANQLYTLNRLTDLGTFKFVNVRFDPPKGDSLKAKVYLTPLLKKSVRVEAQLSSKSNNFVGPFLSASFTNRNFLKGAELFQFKINTGYEVQISGQNTTPINSYELGAEASLAVPRFISPIHISYESVNYVPRTNIKAGFKVQKRVGFFSLNSFNIGYGYLWRESEKKNHELYPIDITYFRIGEKSQAFQDKLNLNPFLKRSFESQFILGSRYTFTYNSQTGEQKEKKTDNIFFSGSLDLSGNLASLIDKITKSKKDSNDAYRTFNSPYSQYTRVDGDLRFYHDFDKKHQFAARLLAGFGFSYGNSSIMPYVKQFSSGGSNSLRAFRARSVGPGSFDSKTQTKKDTTSKLSNFFVDQTGDAKIEASAEYRFGIIGYLKGALFVDAGNIWLMREDSIRPGSAFHGNTFLKQIAVGTGAGLRLDVKYFVLRLDLAFPLRRQYPVKENGDKNWVIKQIDFTDPVWRKNNLVLNVAIGYPF